MDVETGTVTPATVVDSDVTHRIQQANPWKFYYWVVFRVQWFARNGCKEVEWVAVCEFNYNNEVSGEVVKYLLIMQ